MGSESLRSEGTISHLAWPPVRHMSENFSQIPLDWTQWLVTPKHFSPQETLMCPMQGTGETWATPIPTGPAMAGNWWEMKSGAQEQGPSSKDPNHNTSKRGNTKMAKYQRPHIFVPFLQRDVKALTSTKWFQTKHKVWVFVLINVKAKLTLFDGTDFQRLQPKFSSEFTADRKKDGVMWHNHQKYTDPTRAGLI